MTETGPLVSVIIPVYNGETFLGHAIESALCQTWSNIEVIVVDDGSTDRTCDILRDAVAKDSRISVVRQANRGVAHARNEGIRLARGEMIAPLDADDIWEPTKIERQVNRMLECGDETGLVYSWWVRIDADGAVLDRSPRWTIEGKGFDRLLQINYTGNASVPLYRRSILRDASGYDPALYETGCGGCEDWDLALKVALRSSVAVVPEVLVGYRRRSDSMSGSREMMWRSHNAVARNLQGLSPGTEAVVFRQSSSQFALYLAGLSFWSGEYLEAIRWGMRAMPSAVAFRVVPYVIQLLAKRLFHRISGPGYVMRPGVKIEQEKIPNPLLPYDRVYHDGPSVETSRKD